MDFRHPRIAAGVLLAIMALLMAGAAWQDSATVDETTHLSTGYLCWRGERTQMGADDHPPLCRMVGAAPLLFMRLKFSDVARAFLQGELSYQWTRSWRSEQCSLAGLLEPGCKGHYVRLPQLGDVMIRWQCPTRYPFDSWYYWAVPEGQLYAQYFVYDGVNPGDTMLFAGRMALIAVTLLIGCVIFTWTRRATDHAGAALFALALWVFNPLALGYGHLIITDTGAMLGIPLAVYVFTRFVQQPSPGKAALAGAATGLALALKFTSLILAPIYFVIVIVLRKQLRMSVAALALRVALFAVATWCVIMAAYFPHWRPAPAPTPAEASVLSVPGWFQTLRPVLIPARFFKGIALTLGQAPRESYLLGKWKEGGWWYYFPLAFVLKTPVTFVILIVPALVLFLRRIRSADSLELTAWLASAVYVASAMTSGINIGVRHLLPVFPMLSVGIGCAVARLNSRRLQIIAIGLATGQALIALATYPLYIQYFSELVGGARNGYKYLIDSNYDWGQDANRLKKFLDKRQINHIYLDYFGTQFSIEHLQIPNTRVDADGAKHIEQGTLVVSASELVRPEWAWLRESRQPVARVAETLFVYQFP
ncbi:MAG TPA: glycosyltransferase family 39 protein [Verrucomicrobiae bacterium]|nr:glycosyltransferase family 39 protein [Verrucomicrobiae bacterium]